MSDMQRKRIIRNKMHFSDNLTKKLLPRRAAVRGLSVCLVETAADVWSVTDNRLLEHYWLCITGIDISRNLKFLGYVACTGRGKMLSKF